jgi:hypothetical protein
LAKPSSIQLFFAPSSGHLAHGFPLGGLPRILIDHRSSVVKSHTARRPTSLMSRISNKNSSNGSVFGSSSFTRPSKQSSQLDGGNGLRPSSTQAFSFAHWSRGGRAPTQNSTRCPNLDRADSHRLSTPNDQARVVKEDTALFPRGLTVQRHSREFSREHSVLLPPPVTLFERPLKHDSRVNPRYRRTTMLSTSDATYTSHNNSVTTTSPSETDRDESTWTSFSRDNRSSSSGSEEFEVCMPPGSSKA